jgi:hypothetical protein
MPMLRSNLLSRLEAGSFFSPSMTRKREGCDLDCSSEFRNSFSVALSCSCVSRAALAAIFSRTGACPFKA